MRDKAHGAPRHSMKPVAWYLPLLVALVVGCGGAQEAQQTGTGGATAEPKVKLLIMGVAPPVRDFSAMRHGGQPDSFQYRPHYEHLIGIDPKTGGYTPQLATEWTLQPDGLSYRFKLRQGVRFQGTWGDMTAKDVVHTYQQLVRPDSEHGQAFSVRRDVSAVEPVNDHEVIFRLSRPDLGFLSTASEQQSMFPIQSKAHFDTAGEPAGPEAPYIAGTGPYQFKARAQGSYIRFERVPYQHWRILPDFPEFEYRYLKEPSTRLATLLTGEVHVTNLPVDLQPQAVQAGMKIIQGPVPALRTWLNFACCWADLESGKYPEIAFRSSHAVKTTGGQWNVEGKLTLHAVTKPITVSVQRNGDAYAGHVTIKQTDFGIKPISAGGGTVKVKNDLEIEFHILTLGSP